MNESQAELQSLAGEYVLGTLSQQRRREVEQRMLVEPDLRAQVDAWEQRLHPLTRLAEPQEVPAGLWPRIERSLPMPPPVKRAGGWQSWWNNLNFWRWTSAGGLVCSALLVAVMLQGGQARRSANFMVVLVAPQDTVPAWVVQASNRGQLSLIPLTSASVPEQKALQFWTKGQDWNGPVSLGIVKPGRTQSIGLDKLPPLQPNQLFEITLEPSTGSLTGKPSGPILYIGRAVKVTS
ncbi:anti-sigma factor domain-containing protein [Herbaspirillum sp. alder98]|uniref:anti-sigma factor n=1 Tax=Herbaspirillum sp. alder98 TaxID=2913096 RepID=UPI001CD8AD59|nr:anti-sigma factor [Herbaspirillum sp. alder98]MCA1324783.1 anti-sigma factor [Herbaspirillum sp. alder98]